VCFYIYQNDNIIGRIRFFNIQDNGCEIGYWLIKSADVRDIRALCYVIQYLNPWVTIFVPGADKQQLPFAKHKTALLNYLQKHGR